MFLGLVLTIVAAAVDCVQAFRLCASPRRRVLVSRCQEVDCRGDVEVVSRLRFTAGVMGLCRRRVAASSLERAGRVLLAPRGWHSSGGKLCVEAVKPVGMCGHVEVC